MTRLIYICDREPGTAVGRAAQLRRIDDLLGPDNIATRPLRIEARGDITMGLFNPTGAEPLVDTAVGLGSWLPGTAGWHLPGGAVPEGSFALVRGDAHHVEICTDMVGSRSLWYVLTDEAFLVSSSQRALIALLGSFQANRAAFPWILSSGSLGPGNSWDTRLALAPPDSTVRFSRKTGRLSVHPHELEARETCPAGQLHQALERVFGNLELDYQHWVLPLSGGVDSRGLLCYLPKRPGLRAITWGLRESMNDPHNDAFVARRVAERFKIDFQYFELDGVSVDPEQTLRRFFATGEGRVAHVSGYTDGFALWKTLFDEGVLGIIRGDHLFGGSDVSSEVEVRHSKGLLLLTDLLAAEHVATLELPVQTLPVELRRKPGESLARFRDRINRQFRHPIVMSALNELKSPYVEISNPLLYRSLVEASSLLTDDERTEKRTWRRLVKSQCPRIPFAQTSAIGELNRFLAHPATRDVIRASLRSAAAATCFNGAALALAEDSLALLEHQPTAPSRGSLLRRIARGVLPSQVRHHLRNPQAPRLAPGALAFHAYTVTETCRMLTADARALGR